MKSIFEFDDYKAYLTSVEAARTLVQKGFRTQLALQIDCQSAFISQVLNGHANFGLEQGLKVARFLHLNTFETQHFLWMIQYVRAGSEELRKHFFDHLSHSRGQHLHIQSRVSAKTISLETQAIYYSEWYYSAIHMIVTIPQIRSIEKIARALGIAESVVRKAVQFLLSANLLKEESGKILPTETQLHLSHESPLVSRSHSNWRLAAIQSLTQDNKKAVHYSTVSSLSKSDVEGLRRKLLQQIEEYVRTVAKSSEEELYCFNLDFFSLINR